jgi:hemoglobin
MIRHHLGRGISEEQRQHWVRLLLETADEMKLPSDPEFRSALVAYLEWSSRLAVINSALPSDTHIEEAPMPVWGFGGGVFPEDPISPNGRRATRPAAKRANSQILYEISHVHVE